MKTLRVTKDVTTEVKGVVATIGVFDGVHRGHQTIIRRCVEIADEIELPSVLITFDRHPLEVIATKSTPKLLTGTDRKLELVKELGVDYSAVLRFDKEMSEMSPYDFCREILVDGFDIKAVCVGENFHFGSGAMGNVGILRELGEDIGFRVEVVPLVPVEGGHVSSTSIRNFLRFGSVDMARRYLGRFHRIYGKVIEGAARGKRLGFPTANLEIPDKICVPGDGVYAGMAGLQGNTFFCAINIGDKPTFHDRENSVEAHIIGFNGEIYGQEVYLDFHSKIRDELAFGSEDSLKKQMMEDVEEAKRRLSIDSGSGVQL